MKEELRIIYLQLCILWNTIVYWVNDVGGKDRDRLYFPPESNSIRREKMAREGLTESFHDHLIESLRDKEFAKEYLIVALEAFEEDGNMEVFLTKIRDIAQAQGGFSRLSRKTKLNRSNLYTQLSKTGNPSFQTVSRVLNSLGFRLTVELVH